MNKDEGEFGHFLVLNNVLTREKLNEVQSRASDRKDTLHNTLIELKCLSAEEYDRQKAAFHNIPFIDLKHYFSDPQVLGLIEHNFASDELIFPLFLSGSSIAVATSNPSNLTAFDQVRENCNLDVELYYASEAAIMAAIDNNYSQEVMLEDPGEEQDKTHDIPQVVNYLFNKSIRANASDLHIEPGKKHILIRQRVDGLLRETYTLPRHLQDRIVSRIKIMANLDISETRIPQDGQIKTKIAGEDLSLRISTIPTLHGENVVVRFLKNAQTRFSLDILGFSENDLKTFRDMLSLPYGMIIVTGPTGSGKTTTLYGALDQLNTVKKNIMTIEDPVEYHADLLRQVQVNTKTGMTFAKGLRALLRQDPDIIMVGEIRDPETASVAIQAALTGHLVLTTLHTNNAAGAITRLINMGIPPYLISSAVVCIIGQRLVRNLCPACKKRYTAPENISRILPQNKRSSGEITLFAPVGCQRCSKAGFIGRSGIYEVLKMNEEIQNAILKESPTGVYEKIAKKHGMTTMFDDGLEKVVQGLTSLEEIMVANQLTLALFEKEEAPA